MAPKRTIQFKMLLSEEERRMLRGLAERVGVTVSDYVRLFVRQQYAQVASKTTSKKIGKKKR